MILYTSNKIQCKTDILHLTVPGRGIKGHFSNWNLLAHIEWDRSKLDSLHANY